MEDKLKDGVSSGSFLFPYQYETMSIETALKYLDLSEDGHGFLFVPDDFNGFKALLVLKCGVDIDYVFSDTFIPDAAEIKKHISPSQLTKEELEKEVKKRIQQDEEKQISISSAKKRYAQLSAIRKLLQQIMGKSPKASLFDGKSAREIDELYPTRK